MDAIARGLATRALAEIARIDIGEPVELRRTSTHLQWRRVGQPDWVDLVPLADTGAALEFQWVGTELGVRREGETEFEFVDLIGPQGVQGVQGPQGEQGPMGEGVPEGGATGQIIVKDDGVPEGTRWGNVIDEVDGRLAAQAQVGDVTHESGWHTEGTPVSSTFTRASQAWDGTGLVAPDTMRVFGRDTKSPVVLIEGQRTNMLRYSGDFAEWSAYPAGGDTVITPNTAPGPDGTLSAARVSFSGGGNPQNTIKVVGAAGMSVAGREYTVSLWIRADSPQIINLHSNIGAANPIEVTEQWQRFTTTTTGNGTANISLLLRSYPTAETPFDVHIWGGQIEEAPFASSYIPTDGAPATRAADDSLLTNILPDGEFTVHVAVPTPTHGIKQVFGLWRIHRPAGGYIRAFTYDGNIGFAWRDTDHTPIVNAGSTPAPNKYVASFVVGADSASYYVNGVLKGSGEDPFTTGYLPGLYLGDSNPASRQSLYGAIAPGAAQLGIPFIDNRAWSAEEIQAAHARWLPELEKIEVPV